MDVNTSAITGALRVGVQVLVAQKRPVLEVYQQLHNRFGPEIQFELPAGPSGAETRTERTRFQNIFVDLTLVNIGGERAENVSFEVTGDFRRDRSVGQHPEIFSKIIKQLSPGQSIYLMQINQFDLLDYEYSEESGQKVGRPKGTKTDTLNIVLHYDGPGTVLNRILRSMRRLRGLKQLTTEFVFDPQIYQGDLPPAEYS